MWGTKVREHARGATVDAIWRGGCLLLAIGWGLSASGCGVSGSGVSASEERQVSAFQGIKVNGAYTIEASMGPDVKLTVSGDDNLLEWVDTEVVGSWLRVGSSRKISPKLPLVLKVQSPRFERFELNGANVLRADELRGGIVLVKVNGAGDVRLGGVAKGLDLDLKGAAQVDAGRLVAAHVTARMVGASTATVHAVSELDVQLAGAGSLHYCGDPERVSKQVDGVGTLIRARCDGSALGESAGKQGER